MKILLINPIIEGEPEAFHIGLTTIGSYIQAHSSHRAAILDFAFHRLNWQQKLLSQIETFQPDMIGMYISTPFFPSARRVAREIKRIRPDLPILAGGHHASLAPDEVMSDTDFDLLIIGEGEVATLRLLDVMTAGESLDQVPGIWWRKDGEIRQVPKGALLPAAEIPMLDWNLYDAETLEKTFYFWGLLPVMGSRGCPYKCSFCAIPNVQALYKGENFLRFRDPICVVDEIEHHYKQFHHLGLRLVYFYDLNFLVRGEWLKRFVDEYKKRGLNRVLPWSAYTRADHIRRIDMSWLEDSGCVALRVGIEAANEFQRNDVYEKELPQAELLTALAAIKKSKIAIIGYFLVGGPGERPEYLMDSLELSYDYGIEYPTFFLFKPLAGTDIIDRAAEMGSTIDKASMEQSADFLRGVNMTHKHVTTWQLLSFQTLTQVLFGARIIWHQFRREGLMYMPRMLKYFWRARREGFGLFESGVYFVFYGYDHLTAAPRFPIPERRSLFARALFRLLRGIYRSRTDTAPSHGEQAGETAN